MCSLDLGADESPPDPMVVGMSQSDSEEEEELEVQYWRKERHYRETYLQSIEVNFYNVMANTYMAFYCRKTRTW